MRFGRGGENHKLHSSVRAFFKAFLEVLVGVLWVEKPRRRDELLGAELVNPELFLYSGTAVDVVFRVEEQREVHLVEVRLDGYGKLGYQLFGIGEWAPVPPSGGCPGDYFEGGDSVHC